MSDIQQNHSEVAQLIKCIREEYEAGQQALFGLAAGTAQHQFITAKMENICKMHMELKNILGDTMAMKVITEDLA